MLTKLFTTAGLNRRAGNGRVLIEVFWRDNAIVAFKATEVQTQQERSKAQPFVLEKQRGRGSSHPLVLAARRKINKPSDLPRGFSCIWSLASHTEKQHFNSTVSDCRWKRTALGSNWMIIGLQRYFEEANSYIYGSTYKFTAWETGKSLFNHIVFHAGLKCVPGAQKQS